MSHPGGTVVATEGGGVIYRSHAVPQSKGHRGSTQRLLVDLNQGWDCSIERQTSWYLKKMVPEPWETVPPNSQTTHEQCRQNGQKLGQMVAPSLLQICRLLVHRPTAALQIRLPLCSLLEFLLTSSAQMSKQKAPSLPLRGSPAPGSR